MPGIPLVSREANYSRDNEFRIQLSPEEEKAAEESLAVYCKPIELYNVLKHRADHNPSLLRRCLHYNVQEKNKRRVQLSVSIDGSSSTGDGLQTQSLLPLYILLARPVSTPNGETPRSSSYRYKRACKLTAINGTQAKFVLPEISKLSTDVISGSVAMLLVSCADITNPESIDLSKDHFLAPKNGGYCLMGKISIDFLHTSWEKSPNLSLGERVQTNSTVSMQSCFMKVSCSGKEKCVSFLFPHNSEAVSIFQQVPVIITAEELGRKDISPYDLFSYNNIPTNSLPQVIRLRTGNVIFNYKYYNNLLQKSEVTEDYTCPFCLVKCGSYKGLRCHLLASHDLFRYEFWVNQEYQVVIIYARTDSYVSEVFGSVFDLRKEPFFFCHKPMKHRNPASQIQNQNVNHGTQIALVPDTPTTVSDSPDVSEPTESDVHSPPAPCVSTDAIITSSAPESATPSVPPVSNPSHPEMLQFAKTRKLSNEPSEARNQMLLQKRDFFHSHRAQPMLLEQVYAEEDSEDEVDDDVADLEDRRMLDDFVDVDQEEKQMMHLWNSFVRKQRVLADAHVPWACEAFSEVHGEDIADNQSFHWCWQLFLIKLYNHGLIENKTMNKCHRIINKYRQPTQ